MIRRQAVELFLLLICFSRGFLPARVSLRRHVGPLHPRDTKESDESLPMEIMVPGYVPSDTGPPDWAKMLYECPPDDVKYTYIVAGSKYDTRKTTRRRREWSRLVERRRMIERKNFKVDEDFVQKVKEKEKEEQKKRDEKFKMKPKINRKIFNYKSPFTGLPIDPVGMRFPPIGKYWSEGYGPWDGYPPDNQLEMNLTPQERVDNWKQIQQIQNRDIPAAEMLKQWEGVCFLMTEQQRLLKLDPWFYVNNRREEAYYLGAPQERVEYLDKLLERLGGPPPGFKVVEGRGYAELAWEKSPYRLKVQKAKMEDDKKAAERELRRRSILKANPELPETPPIPKPRFKKESWKQMREEYRKAKKEGKPNLLKVFGTLPGKFGGSQMNPDYERRELGFRKLLAKYKKSIADDEKKQKKHLETLRKKYGDLDELPEPVLPTTDIGKYMDVTFEGFRSTLRKRRLGSDDLFDVRLHRTEQGYEEAMKRKKIKFDPNASLEELQFQSMESKRKLPDKYGRIVVNGDLDMRTGEVDNSKLKSHSETVTGPVSVAVTSCYDYDNSNTKMRMHVFNYSVSITNNSPTETIQLLRRRFEVQNICNPTKEVLPGNSVAGTNPVLKPGESFNYTSSAPLNVRPVCISIAAARMRGEYGYAILKEGQVNATEAQYAKGGDTTAELGTFHFILPKNRRARPIDIDRLMMKNKDSSRKQPLPVRNRKGKRKMKEYSELGDTDIRTGDVSNDANTSSNTVTDQIRVTASSLFQPERTQKGSGSFSFSYKVHITNESKNPIQVLRRKFAIQTVGNATKSVIEGSGVAGRQPVIKPDETFEYNAVAPISIAPMLDKTRVMARMQGSYFYVVLKEDGVTPVDASSPKEMKMGPFHFVLPADADEVVQR